MSKCTGRTDGAACSCEATREELLKLPTQLINGDGLCKDCGHFYARHFSQPG
eukprot:GDKH01016175.1.p1 GENE.GDKH01016175.1~~GDKH01016175.1.p1  ORF type:complete len:52 (+),score=5.46 GDKH01016175.1:61-216(+)